jgi:hypothetical protein
VTLLRPGTPLITSDAFGELFTSYLTTADRLEVRDHYDEGEYLAKMNAFLAGEGDDLAWMAPWFDLVRRNADQGKIMRRVRVITTPLTAYSQWALHVSAGNNAAGEHIRYLHRPDSVGLPDLDYWIFDHGTAQERAAIVHFDAADQLLGAEIITNRPVVNELQAAFDDAWRRSLSRDDFAAHYAKEHDVG